MVTMAPAVSGTRLRGGGPAAMNISAPFIR